MTRWICRLDPNECQAWDNNIFDEHAIKLGINGWIIPVSWRAEKPLPWQPVNHHFRILPYALEVAIQEDLTPRQEQKLIKTIEPHIKSKNALQINKIPIIIIKNLHHLSSLHFGLKRLRQGLPKSLILSSSSERSQIHINDGLLLDGWVDTIKLEHNFLRYLKTSHHRLGTGQLEIPSIRALTTEEDQYCLNGSPEHYREWAVQASSWSTLLHNGNSKAPVIIDGWHGHQRWTRDQTNEQSKGTTVDISTTYVPNALADTKEWGKPNTGHLALLIHAYYPDILKEMLTPLSPQANYTHDQKLDIYISTPRDKVEIISKILRNHGWPTVKIFGVDNYGRDIAPFLLHLLPEARKNKHTYFIKAHTKLSPHLGSSAGKNWSQHLRKCLLSQDSLQNIKQYLKKNEGIGLIAPAGTLLPISVELHGNSQHLLKLLKASSLDGSWALQKKFIAGSMFAGRIKAYENVHNTFIKTMEFESEAKQTNGTLSHALERWLSLIPQSEGWDIEELREIKTDSTPGFGYNKIA